MAPSQGVNSLVQWLLCLHNASASPGVRPQHPLRARLLFGVPTPTSWSRLGGSVGKVEAGPGISMHSASQLTKHHSYPFSNDLGK